jgi:RHS repeat-associated protein
VRSHFYLGNLLVATRNTSGGYTYWASDHLGTPRVGTGANPETHKYQPFGLEIPGASGGLPIKFASMERDVSSGNDFDHARYQSSLLGRFLSPDLINGIPDEPQSWNRYSYTLNNPLKYVDPTGLLTVTVSACPALQICTEEEITVSARDPLKEQHEALLTEARQELILQDLRDQLRLEALIRSTDRFLSSPLLGLGIHGMSKISKPSEINFLRRASVLDRNALTRAGRALQKHQSRTGSAFPKAKTHAQLNQVGQQIVDDIVSNPQSVWSTGNRARFGDVIEVVAPDGRGIRFDQSGNLLGLLEP